MVVSTRFLASLFGVIVLSLDCQGFLLPINPAAQRALHLLPLLESPNPKQENEEAKLDDSINTNGATDLEKEAFNRANRFSKFAPDTQLPADEFRAQLRENMKADLEKRRQQDPNRGNQPARSYLDGL